MLTTINNALIRSFNSCYDPSEVGIPDNETLSIIEWVEKYRNVVKNKEDIIWLLCRKEFMSDKDLRLFAVWCARESFKVSTFVDERNIEATNVAERFANGEATDNELSAAWLAARSAASAAWSAESAAWSAASAAWSAESAAWLAARSAASAASAAAWSAARSADAAARSVARSEQIDKLLSYFK